MSDTEQLPGLSVADWKLGYDIDKASSPQLAELEAMLAFVQGPLTELLADLPRDGLNIEEFLANNLRILGSRCSKTINPGLSLPLFLIEINGASLFFTRSCTSMRWILSVAADRHVHQNLDELVNRTERIGVEEQQGLPPEWIFETYACNHRRFTVVVQNDYALYTVLYLII